MATRTTHEEANVGPASEQPTMSTTKSGGQWTTPRLTNERVWQTVARASFAVLSHVTPAGEPRSSGVVYKAVGRPVVTSRSHPIAGRRSTSRRRVGSP
jgi:hypothetical protein